jgi:hypothetical protein
MELQQTVTASTELDHAEWEAPVLVKMDVSSGTLSAVTSTATDATTIS